ncbi:hypothetical protein D3C72_2376070 [compost metagenome]
MGREHLGVHGGHRTVGQTQSDSEDKQCGSVEQDVLGIDQHEHGNHPREDQAVTDQERLDATNLV